MNVNPAEIECIVREVLAELIDGAPGNGRAMPGPPAVEEPAAAEDVSHQTDAPAPFPNPGEVVVAARVVTLAQLDGRLESARRLIVPAGAVVTPAVRDELIRRKIKLSYAAAANGETSAPLRLVTYIVARGFDASQLGSALEKTSIGVEPHRSECLIASTEALAREVKKPNTLGLLLTRHTAAGLCLANRHAGVRALFGCSPGGVAAGAEAVGANVLVANAAAPSFELRQIVGSFCRGGVKPCPEVFQEQLA